MGSSDSYMYGNATAVGSQIYPYGLSKYYDMYSWDGFISYCIAWIVQAIWWILSFITVLPVPAWLKLFDGGDFGDLITFLIWYPNWFGIMHILSSFFNVTMENGWS